MDLQMLTKDAWTMQHCYGQVKGGALFWMLDAGYSMLDRGIWESTNLAKKAPRRGRGKVVARRARRGLVTIPDLPSSPISRLAAQRACPLRPRAHFTLAGLNGASLNSLPID